jgi:hypothetical protein
MVTVEIILYFTKYRIQKYTVTPRLREENELDIFDGKKSKKRTNTYQRYSRG